MLVAAVGEAAVVPVDGADARLALLGEEDEEPEVGLDGHGEADVVGDGGGELLEVLPGGAGALQEEAVVVPVEGVEPPAPGEVHALHEGLPGLPVDLRECVEVAEPVGPAAAVAVCAEEDLLEGELPALAPPPLLGVLRQLVAEVLEVEAAVQGLPGEVDDEPLPVPEVPHVLVADVPADDEVREHALEVEGGDVLVEPHVGGEDEPPAVPVEELPHGHHRLEAPPVEEEDAPAPGLVALPALDGPPRRPLG